MAKEVKEKMLLTWIMEKDPLLSKDWPKSKDILACAASPQLSVAL